MVTPQYSFSEELAHAITHGIGVVLGIVGFVVLLIFSSFTGDAWNIASVAIYGTTLILLYLSSTLYHSFPQPRLKRIFRIMDHSAIYLLIAGTYTPLLLVSLRGPLGASLCALLWGVALAGILFKIFFIGRFSKFSTGLYIVMGWIAVLVIKPMMASIAPGGLLLILAGGITYTLGVIFYAMTHVKYHHAIWHLFVLGGEHLAFLCRVVFYCPRIFKVNFNFLS